MADKKGKALTRAEKDKLRELDRENAKVSQEAEIKKQAIHNDAEQRRKETRRKSTDVIKAYHDGFDKQKKDLDRWLATEENKLKREYGKKLDGLKADRKTSYEEEERIMEGNLAEVEAWESDELRKIETATQEKIREIAMAKEVITGPIREAEKKAKEKAEKEKKKSAKEEDETPVEVPVERPGEDQPTEQAAQDSEEPGGEAGDSEAAREEGDRPAGQRAG